MQQKLKLNIDVGANLEALDKFMNKLNQAEKLMEKFSGNDKLNNLINGIFGANIGGIGGAAGGFLGGPIGAIIGSTIQKIVGSLGELVVKVASGMGNLLLDFGKRVIDAAAYRQNNIMTLSKLVPGGMPNAVKEFDTATRIADKTSFETKDIVDLTRRLYQQNFKPAEADTLRAYALDLASLQNADPEVLKRFTDFTGKVKGKGKYTGETVS